MPWTCSGESAQGEREQESRVGRTMCCLSCSVSASIVVRGSLGRSSLSTSTMADDPELSTSFTGIITLSLSLSLHRMVQVLTVFSPSRCLQARSPQPLAQTQPTKPPSSNRHLPPLLPQHHPQLAAHAQSPSSSSADSPSCSELLSGL